MQLNGLGVTGTDSEVFFRRHAFSYLSLRAGRLPAYTFSCVLFAIAHFNPSAVPEYLVIGVVLAYAYERSGRLIAPVAAHAIVNAVALLLT